MGGLGRRALSSVALISLPDPTLGSSLFVRTYWLLMILTPASYCLLGRWLTAHHCTINYNALDMAAFCTYMLMIMTLA